MVGTTISHYKVIEKIGQGGRGRIRTMMEQDYSSLVAQAKEVLEGNWLGSSTKPAPRLYPHQWSWDSAFIAIAYSHYNQERAEQELRSLFRGQWDNGLLPHIVFNTEAGDYLPGPEFWQTDRSPHSTRQPLTSGIIQPPVHATAVLHVYRYAQDRRNARTFLEEMFPKLQTWHSYLYRERDPENEGLIYIRHPWESGQDNSPIWDRVLNSIELTPEMVPKYQRVDTTIVDSSDRPSNLEYDRYAYLVKLGYEHDYDEARIRDACPFLIQDVLFNALLVGANRDLADIARLLGEDPSPFEARAKQTADGLNAKLWDKEHGVYFDYDMTIGEPIDAYVGAGFSPLYAMVPTAAQAEQMIQLLNSSGFCRLSEVCWSVPSYDKEAPGFSPNRYWRGPIWINVNWVIYQGLRRYGFHDYADRVKLSIIQLPQQFGFHEYFDPDEGKGHGSDNFSWTAALMLDLLLEEGA